MHAKVKATVKAATASTAGSTVTTVTRRDVGDGRSPTQTGLAAPHPPLTQSCAVGRVDAPPAPLAAALPEQANGGGSLKPCG